MGKWIRAGLFLLILGFGPSLTRADRILRFPKDQSLGWLTVHDSPAQIDGPRFLANQSRVGWESHGLAQGDVVIPDGKLVWLSLSHEVWYDPEQLVALRMLRPDDLFGLSAYASMSGVLKPNNRCMPYIAHLTGLRALNMRTTNITDRGAAYLANLTALEWLTFGGRITTKGLLAISAIPALRGLILSSADAIPGALSSLGHQPSLQALGLNGNMIADNGLQHLDNFPALQHLKLWGAFGPDALHHLGKTPQLTSLGLEMRGPLEEETLAHLADLKRLRTLKVRSELDDRACAQLARLDQLEELDLAFRNKIGDAGAVHLAGLPRLKRLSLNSVTLSDEGLESLAQLRHLESLLIRVPELSEDGLRHLASMRNLKQLTLEIKALACSDAYLGEALSSLTQLETLSLYMPISGQTVVAIAEIPGLTRLTIRLQPGVTNAALSALGNLDSLRYLSLDCKGQLSTGGLSHLNSLPQLESLKLSGLKRDSAAIDISGLVNLTNLTIRMRFERNGKVLTYEPLRDDDLASLAEMTKLEHLQLGGPGVGDEGVAHLAKLKNLGYLFTQATSMSDEGLRHLSRLEALSWLTIQGGQFTDEGLAHLRHLKRLSSLDLTSSRGISAKAAQDLQQRLPNLTSITIDSPRLTMK